VTSGGQDSSSLTGLVDGAVVVGIVLHLEDEARLEPDHRALDEEDLVLTLVQESGLGVPSASLNEHSAHVDAVIRRNWVLILDDFVVEYQLVYGDLVLSGIVLQ
jgi:hypothetical protein